MKYRILLPGFMMLTITACSGPNTVARNVETAASLNALAGVPGAGLIGLAASAVDLFSGFGKPKLGKTSEKLSACVSKTPSIFWGENGQYKWGEYAVWRENGETKRVKIDQIPQENLNLKAAWAKAVGLIPQGVFAEGNQDLQARNLDAWKKGETVVVEYAGLNGATVVAVSKNKEPFEIMLPGELAAITDTKSKGGS